MEEKGRISSGIKYELIGGGSPITYTLFLTFFIVGCTLHTYPYTICIVAIVDCTHVYCVVKNIRTHYTLLLLLTAHLYCQLQLALWTCNIAQVNPTSDVVLIEDQLWLLLDMVIVDQEEELHKPNS